MIKIEQQVQQQAAETTLGQLKGPKGLIGLNPANVAGTKRVVVLVKQANGDTYQCLCSPAVSELLRTKEITVGNLLTFPVREQVLQNGEIINLITRPGSAIDWQSPKPAEYQPVADLQDLITW